MEAEDSSGKPKQCFVIGPIGEAGSETRQRADKVYRHVIRPAAEACGYRPLRADEDPRPGAIGSQVIDHLFDDDLVVADLTDYNPNVFYELAIRHATHRPIVQIIQADQRIPFDLVQQRTIKLDHTDLDSAEYCRDELIKQIRAVEEDPSLVDNPISQARRIQSWQQSPDPEVRRDADIIGMLQSLNVRIDRLARGFQGPEASVRIDPIELPLDVAARVGSSELRHRMIRIDPDASEETVGKLTKGLYEVLERSGDDGGIERAFLEGAVDGIIDGYLTGQEVLMSESE